MILKALINWLPIWLFIILITILLMSLSAIIFWLVRKFFPHLIKHQSSDILSILIGVISTNYGFLVGFVIIILWQSYNQATLVVYNEANYLSLILYDCAAFPMEIKTEITETVGKYIHILINEEWDLMKWGRVSDDARLALGKIFTIIQSYTPNTETEKAFYSEAISNLNSVLENRRLRIEKVESALPDTLRFILIFGVLIVAFFVSLLETKYQRVHLFVTLVVTAIMSFNVGLALTLDYPFSGYISVANEPYTRGILAQYIAYDF